MSKETIGITGYDSYTYVVENLERSRAFYTSRFDFREMSRATREHVEASGEGSVVYGAGDVRVLVTAPLTQSSAAAKYLRRHPAGINKLAFRVRDLDHTRAFLKKRNATFLGGDVDVRDAQGGRYRSFSIATPLGEVAFSFVERTDFQAFAPGFENVAESAAHNRFGFQRVDHVTSNLRTMAPLIDWYRSTLGMEQFWDIEFHTDDVAPGRAGGTGLKSIVMWEPESGVKFATNEPLQPHFEDSQIAKFVYDNHGPGIQHLAFGVPDVISTVEELRRRDVKFLPTPAVYYRDLPARLEKLKITNVKEDLATLEKNEILVDGENDKYMLQIFLREAAGLYDDERAGPFFYEVIQRAGDEGFGYGNFRALFESIEREQRRNASPPGLTMRLARAIVGDHEVSAIEHGGALYRVDRLDTILGVALPEDVLPAASFARRVLSLGVATLEAHAEALAEGTQLEDARLEADARLLPPTGDDPVVLELPARSAISYRVSGRSTLGHCAPGIAPRDVGPLSVSPALAIVVGEDLHRPSVAEARRAILGVTLALAWSAVREREAAMSAGLGPSPARDVGTHLGPTVTIDFRLDAVAATLEIDGRTALQTTLTAGDDRVAEALARAARYGDLRAGDVLLLPAEVQLSVPPGRLVSLRAEGLGRLDGVLG